MKTYEVEMRHTSFVVVTVEAESVEQAEELAWWHQRKLNSYGELEVESVELTQGETA
jgi:hypothetical protein